MLPIVAHEHRADTGSGQFSCQLQSAERRNDTSGVDQLVGSIEQLQAVEEERSFLRVEQREPLVEQHLPDIRLDLREIGIDRRVQAQILSNSPANVAAQLASLLVVTAIPDSRCTIGTGSRCRSRFEYQPASHVAESFKRTGLREEIRVRAYSRRPGVLKTRVLDTAKNVNPPALH